jgi:DNA-directed RNA polymerase specialized sigma24 family protein
MPGGRCAVCDPTCVEFEREFGVLVACLQKRGFEREQANDAASEAMTRAYQRWSRIDRLPLGWLHQVAYHFACRQAQRAHKEPFRALTGGWAISTYNDLDVVEITDEYKRLLRLLHLLPRQQRRVMERHLEGLNTDEISDQLDMLLPTVRSNLRHGRKTLHRLVVTDEQELDLQAKQQLWEAFQSEKPLPAAPRLVILRAWKRAKDLNVPPDRGKKVELLGRDEVQRRLHESPLTACAWALKALVDLGKATEQMMVVADPDGVVLWRGGARRVLGLADQLGFVEGAHWDIRHAGANGIALALTTRQTVTVCRWEHYVRAQHGLSCVAAPVRSPQDERVLCVLNLTGTEPTIPRDILRKVDTLARCVAWQLRALPTPHGGR